MTRSWWGWGMEEQRLEAAALGPMVREALGFGAAEVEAPVRLEDVVLPPPRIATPWSSAARDRIGHAHGASYRDTVRAFRGRIDHPPDAVAFARTEADVERALEWAAGADVAVVPYGGGTSVVGGVECPLPPGFDGVLALDLGGLGSVLEVDPVSRSARVQAGVAGPALEAQLAAHGMTMRFSPRASSCRRSAAGSPRARAGTSPRCGPTSTTSWSPSGPSRRSGRGRAGGCRARAPAPRRTACCSAARARSA